jgi:hypothetical protein
MDIPRGTLLASRYRAEKVVGRGATGILYRARDLLLDETVNEIVFELLNDHGFITYGFEIQVGEAIVFRETCGQVFRLGCENDQKFPPGVIRRFS